MHILQHSSSLKCKNRKYDFYIVFVLFLSPLDFSDFQQSCSLLCENRKYYFYIGFCTVLVTPWFCIFKRDVVKNTKNVDFILVFVLFLYFDIVPVSYVKTENIAFILVFVLFSYLQALARFGKHLRIGRKKPSFSLDLWQKKVFGWCWHIAHVKKVYFSLGKTYNNNKLALPGLAFPYEKVMFLMLHIFCMILSIDSQHRFSESSIWS